MQFRTAIHRLGHRLGALVRRLHTRERGASMTEFVITLPIFLILFQGIMTLGELQRESVGVKIEASQNMWDDAISIQHSTVTSAGNDPPHMDTSTAGAEAIGYLTSGSTSLADGFAAFKNGALTLGGHYGEAGALVGAPSAISSTAGSAIPRVSSNMPGVYPDAENHLNEPFATEHVDDGKLPQLPTSPGGLSQVTSSLSVTDVFNGFRQAMGAGIRYGIARGQASNSVNIPGFGPQNFQASYDTLAAPRSKSGGEEIISVAISRLGAEDPCGLSNILGISYNQPFSGC